jgi:asparagine synthase (glutamine-hydrolysing)
VRAGRVAEVLRFAARHQRAYGVPPLRLRTMLASPRFGPLAKLIDRTGAGTGLAPSALLGPELAAAPAHDAPFVESLQDVLVQQTTRTSLPSLLRFEDRNSMAHSIEGRVPYLDHRLVELAFSLAEDARLRGMQPKWVLRQAVADLLPREVLDRRDKIGFRADTGATRRFVRAHERELLEARTPWERDWLDPGAVRRLLTTGANDDPVEFATWRLVNVKLWLRQHWDGGREPVGASRVPIAAVA